MKNVIAKSVNSLSITLYSRSLYILYVQAYALAVLIAVVTPVRRVITNDQGLTGGPSSIVTFLILFVVSLLFLIVQSFAYQQSYTGCQAFQSTYQIL